MPPNPLPPFCSAPFALNLEAIPGNVRDNCNNNEDYDDNDDGDNGDEQIGGMEKHELGSEEMRRGECRGWKRWRYSTSDISATQITALFHQRE